MADMKAFEIHTFQGGKWKIDSVFDDRDLALFEAQRMDESGRYSGIRVIEEIYVEQTQETKTRTIYRGSKIHAANEAELRKSKQVRIQAEVQKKRRHQETMQRSVAARQRRVRKKSSPLRLILISIFLAVLAAGALVGIQYVEHM